VKPTGFTIVGRANNPLLIGCRGRLRGHRGSHQAHRGADPGVVAAGFWLGVHKEPIQLNQGQLAALGAGLMAFGGYLVRQFTKFKNRKIQFMKALSANLYLRNLDNDAGVFHHLLDAAQEEEVKEAVLAYHFLRTAGRPLTAAELDRRIEDWFARRWEAAIDFEVGDGVDKLRRLRLVDDDGQGRLTAVTLNVS
jgi:hypothetical protein